VVSLCSSFRPAPLETELVVLILLSGTNVACRFALADQNAVFDTPDRGDWSCRILLLGCGVPQVMGPARQVLAVKKRDPLLDNLLGLARRLQRHDVVSNKPRPRSRAGARA